MTRLALLAPLALLLLGAAAPAVEVPVGKFMTWGIHPAAALRFRSGGLTIDVTAQPCPPKPQTEGCSFDGVNNQAAITVTAPGLQPFSMTSDGQASFVRIAAVRLDQRDSRLGVIVDNQWGGSSGITKISFIQPAAGGFREVAVQRRSTERELQGEIADFPRDLSHDGLVDVVLEDSLPYRYVCNGCTPRLPLVLSVVGGHTVDISAQHAMRSIFARDMRRWRAGCHLHDRDTDNACAAYMADAARAGQLTRRWRDMLMQRHSGGDLWQDCTGPYVHGECPPGATTHYRSFPESLRAFLVATGYITSAQAAALPLPAAG